MNLLTKKSSEQMPEAKTIPNNKKSSLFKTKDYKEYEVTTFRTPQDRNSTDKDDQSYIFTSVTDSMIFCNEKMTIQMPKKSFMMKAGKRKS